MFMSGQRSFSILNRVIARRGVALIDGPGTRNALTRFRVEGDGSLKFTVGTLRIRDLIDRVERVEGFIVVPVVLFESFRRDFSVRTSGFVKGI